MMQRARSFIDFSVALLSIAGLTAGCMEAADRGLGPSCQAALEAAEADLKHARANSIGKAFHWSRAAALIGAARTQQQFSEYQNCVIKANAARAILARNE
jgi:hypothetical protein